MQKKKKPTKHTLSKKKKKTQNPNNLIYYEVTNDLSLEIICMPFS